MRYQRQGQPKDTLWKKNKIIRLRHRHFNHPFKLFEFQWNLVPFYDLLAA